MHFSIKEVVISGPGSHLIFSQPSVVSFFVRLLVGYFIKTQRNTQMYAFALRNTTVNHIRGCVVKILYPTLPRFQSKMAIVWDRSIANNFNRVFKEIASYYRLLLPLLSEAVPAHHNVPDEGITSVVDCEQKLSPTGLSKTSSFYIITSPITAISNSPVRKDDVPPPWKQTEIFPIPKPPMLPQKPNIYDP